MPLIYLSPSSYQLSCRRKPWPPHDAPAALFSSLGIECFWMFRTNLALEHFFWWDLWSAQITALLSSGSPTWVVDLWTTCSVTTASPLMNALHAHAVNLDGCSCLGGSVDVAHSLGFQMMDWAAFCGTLNFYKTLSLTCLLCSFCLHDTVYSLRFSNKPAQDS